jgi:glycosyltransferase involved in cell wall biosynthesis
VTSVLHVIGNLETGGAETQLAMYLRHTRIADQAVLALEPGHSRAVGIPDDVSVDVAMSPRGPNPRTVSALVERFSALPSDAVVCCWDFRPFVLGAAAARLSRRRTVANVRNMGYFYGSVHRAAEWVSLRLADVVVTNSLASARRIAMVARHAECVRIPNGVESCRASDGQETRAAVRSRLGLTDSDVVFVNVGRFDPIKGQAILAEAFGACAASFSGAHLLIVGRGVTGAAAQLRTGPAAARVHLVEDSHDVSAYLLAADVYALPSLSEGMPNALMEGLACGLPAVATDVPGVEDLVEAGVPLRVVSAGDVEGLADEMRRMLEDRGSLRAIGRASANVLASEFSVEAMSAAYDRLFSDMGADVGLR